MCDISVVVANAGGAGDAQECVDSVLDACRGLSFEVLVAAAEHDAVPHPSRRSAPGDEGAIRHVECAAGSLVPHLWAAGIRAARGRVVALTIAEMRVSTDWARSLLRAMDAGAPTVGGVGGGFALGRSPSAAMRAMFYLRYHAFLAPKHGRVGYIAGDNAAYRRDALQAHADSFVAGFWEVDFHRLIAADGLELRIVPDAPVLADGKIPMQMAVAQRYRHGRQFGRWRVETGARRPWQIAAAAPLVPVILTIRIARGVLTARRGIGRFALSVPAILLLASAWAFGELRGALGGPNALALKEAAA